MQIDPGTRFGPYEVVRPIGSGGMGDVYLARDLRLDRDLAIKFLREGGKNRVQVHRFEREARAASALNHPSIITVYDIGEFRGHPYIAMEYIEGQRLRDVIARGPLDAETALAIATDVADALAAAHQRGIAHRDLKPENVMITSSGRAKVLDFGLAKSADTPLSPTETTETLPGVIVGTAGYMAPEQARGTGSDYRSDQFALGTMLYELLTGFPPFRRATTMDTIAAILQEEPQPVSETRPEVSQNVIDVIDRCLRKQPSERYASTLDLAHDLRRAQRQSSSDSQPVPVVPAGSGRHLPLLLAAGVVVAALTVGLTLVRDGGPGHEAAGMVASGPAMPSLLTIAVLPFRDSSGDMTRDYRGYALAEIVAMQLGRVKGINVVSPAAIPADVDARDARAVAQYFGANAVLNGILDSSTGRLRTEWSLFHPTAGVQFRSGVANSVGSDLWALRDSVVESVTNALGLPQADIPSDVLTDLRDPAAQDRYAKAVDALRRYDDPTAVDLAISLLEPLARANPESALVHAALGRAYLHDYEIKGDAASAARAIASARKAAALDEELPEVHVTLGHMLTATGNPQEAIKHHTRALQLQPRNSEAQLRLAQALDRAGESERAEEAYRQVIAARPESWAAYNMLGVFHLHRGNVDAAIQNFSKVTELQPENGRALSNLTAVLLMKPDFEQAIRAARRATELQPTNPVGFTNLGVAYYYSGDLELSRDAFSRAVELAPASPSIRVSLADALHAMGAEKESDRAYEAAIPLALEALRVNPADVSTRRYLVFAYSRTGQPERARQQLDSALALAPTDADVLFYAGVFALEQNDRDRAITLFSRAVGAGYPLPFLKADPVLRPLLKDPDFLQTISTLEAKQKPA